MLSIALRTDGRRALIVGGGNVAARKAQSLLDAGVTLVLVAPRIAREVRALLDRSSVTIHEREYNRRDLDGVDIVIAATDRPEINQRVVADARAARILACDAAQPEGGDFSMQATVRVGGLTFAIDSGNSSPAFSRRIARELRDRFGPEYGAAARTMARMRTYVRTVLEKEQRAPVLRELAELPIDELARMNPVEAEHFVEELISARVILSGATLSERSESKWSAVEGHPERSAAGAESKGEGRRVVCASRASALAMTQTRIVAAKLAERGIATTILNLSTTGDRVQDRPVNELGDVNVWVKELELALLDGRADYAVHSCKDLPGTLADGMHLAAISQREDPRDAFCSERYVSFDALPPGSVVGTSSPRRRAQLHALRPDLRYETLRGNVDTRLRKLREESYDAIVIAMAGINRLGVRAAHTLPFPVETIVPAVGQGALAIETLATNATLAAELSAAINHEPTQWCVEAERTVLRTLRAGCSAPLGVHARIDGGVMTVEAAFATSGGSMLRERSAATIDSIEAARALGETLGSLLARGANERNGRVVLLARTQNRPSRIAAQLRDRGVEVVELREGELDPQHMKTVPHMLLFPSSGAVAAAGSYLDWLRAQPSRPLVAAMGARSGAAASAAGFAPDIVSPDASIEAFVAAVAQLLELR